jgi:hypothetical protein
MRNKLRVIMGAAGVAAVLGIAACEGKTVVVPQAATPTVTVTNHATPAPTATNVQPSSPTPAPPATTPATSYAQDITNAGIVAPVAWIDSTGQKLCADWQSGMSTADTDQILLSGGIHPNHVAIFDSITNTDLCPGVTR